MFNKLYHIELAEFPNEIEEFIPRVPSSIYENENNNIKRICVAKTLSGCLGSAPWGGCNFEELSDKQVFRVYEFNTADIKEGNLITSDYLYKKDLVRDADIYGECWIVNQSIKPCNVFYMELNNCMFESEDIISYSDLKLIEIDEDAIEELSDRCCTKIELIDYSIIDKSNVNFGILD